MEQWVRLCGIKEAPKPGEVTEVESQGKAVCLANIDGTLHATDNLCPHRQGPLGAGWVEGRTVVCPWHAWAFDVETGIAQEPERAKVAVYPLRTSGDDVLVSLY